MKSQQHSSHWRRRSIRAGNHKKMLGLAGAFGCSALRLGTLVPGGAVSRSGDSLAENSKNPLIPLGILQPPAHP
jgi:hypothetical protein